MRREERSTGYILTAVISVGISLFLEATLLRIYEIKMQERIAKIYEILHQHFMKSN